MLKIGLIDSGFGGVSVLKDFLKIASKVKFYYYADLKYAPYGDKNKDYVKKRIFHIINTHFLNKIDIILIACNTATKACIEDLRKEFKFPIFGMQPALKPALLENPNSKIGILATPLMLKESFYFLDYKRFYFRKFLYTLPCFGLSTFIDNFDLKSIIQYVKKISFWIRENKIDVVVLGCTHYTFLKSFLSDMNPKIRFYDGNLGTISHIRKTCYLPKYQIGQNFYEVNSSSHDILYRKKVNILLKFNFGV